MPALIFPWSTSIELYTGFIVCVLLAIFIDLGILGHPKKVTSYKAALVETVIWVLLAILFGCYLYIHVKDTMGQGTLIAKEMVLEFFTGYVIEKSLSIDNIFVFCVIFSAFKIPTLYQKRVLLVGILSAIVLRGIFISIGSVLMQYQFVSIFFGILLVVTGIKMCWLAHKSNEFKKNVFIEWILQKLPLTRELEGDHFFVKKNHKLYATPLFAAFLFIELSDVIFAVDSVPAIFAVTNEPFIVFTSNIFAILGLRSLYSILADLSDRFYYVKYGVAGILVFVGFKLTFHEQVKAVLPITWSLVIILSVLTISILASVWFPHSKGKSG